MTTNPATVHFYNGAVGYSYIDFVYGSTFSENATFTNAPGASKVPIGYKIVSNSDGNGYHFSKVTESEAVAKIVRDGQTLFLTSLTSTSSVMTEGDIFTLLTNLTETLNIGFYSGTVDLNGKSITVSGEGAYGIEVSPPNRSFDDQTGHLIIIKNGTVDADMPIHSRSKGSSILHLSVESDVTLTSGASSPDVSLGAKSYMDFGTGTSSLDVTGFLAEDAGGAQYICGELSMATNFDTDHNITLMSDFNSGIYIAKSGNWTVNLGDHVINTTAEGIRVEGSGVNLTINGGVIHSDDVGAQVWDPAVDDGRSINSTLTLNDVTIVSQHGFAVYAHGLNNDITININGGSITASNGTGVYFPSDGTLNIDDAKISGLTGVEMRKGVLNISGDNTEITSTATNYSKTKTPSSGGSTVTGAAIAISPYGGLESMVVNISDNGKFTGQVAFAQVNADGNEAPEFDFEISGGTFTSNGSDGTGAYPAIVAVKDEISDGFVTGGTFMSGTEKDTSVEQYLDPVYSIDPESGEISFDESKVVATIGDDHYASLADAIAAAQDEDIIILSKDVVESVSFDRDISVTLDLGEHSLGSSTTVVGLAASAGALTIDATTGSITGSGVAINIKTGAVVTIIGGTLSGGDKAIQMTGENSSLEIGGNTTITGSNGVGVYGGYLKMSGGTIDVTNFGIAGNGTYDGTTIDITGGTITSESNAIYHPQEGDISISGGDISGLTGLWYSGTGKITISGGTIRSIDMTDRTNPYKPPDQDDGTSFDGAALSIVSRGDDYQSEGDQIIVEITGGTLESVANQAIRDYRFSKVDGEWQTNDSSDVESTFLAELSISGDTVVKSPAGKPVLDVDPLSKEKNTYAVSGGTFSSDISEYCVPGFEPVRDANGNYVVGSDEPDQPVIDPDDDELPPFIPAQPDDDDSVTIVACAAAAVVVALMAVFLILTYRKE